MTNFAELDATAQAELVRKKEVTASELVEAAIQRIEQLNPQLNAVVTPIFEQAREEASGPASSAHFAGVPFLVKDLLAVVKGVRLTAGSAFFQDYVPDYDSELIVRLKRAGFVIIGKTNTPEFGIVPTTEPHFLGACNNPWNTGHTTGGSSGGSACAVAARLVPAAHANDGGGSIRIPASCCGVFGLKPTRGRNPMGPDYGDVMHGFVAEHVVTKSVRDSAAILDATAGPDVGDPYWAPPPARPFLQEASAAPGKLRIAFTTVAATGVPVHEDCVKAVYDAAKLCMDLGHEVVEENFQIEIESLVESFLTIWAAAVTWEIDSLAKAAKKKPAQEHFEPLTWTFYEMGKQYPAPKYLLALQDLQRMARQISQMFVKYDVCLTPTLAEPPVPLGTFDSPPEYPLQGFMRAAGFAPFTPVCNITGQPAMSVPLYWNAEGLPIGAHFMGRYGDEAALFRLAAQLETARPWAHRKPPVSA